MKLPLFVLLLFSTSLSYSQDKYFEEHRKENIQKIISAFQNKDVDRIASLIEYPLRREYPIPGIKNKEEPKKRFAEVFDKTLTEKIANSRVAQWSEMGWRGTMLDNGVVWINSYTGKIVGVNYQGDFEKKLKKMLIAKQKKNIHQSLTGFENPVYKINTQHYLIRIDELADKRYRYACWKAGNKESAKPDIILTNGRSEFQGSGGNHVIHFSTGNYQYEIAINVIREEKVPEAVLVVRKDNRAILTEGGSVSRE